MKTRREAVRCLLLNSKKSSVRCSHKKRSWSKCD